MYSIQIKVDVESNVVGCVVVVVACCLLLLLFFIAEKTVGDAIFKFFI
jgi:hypothetical protein